MPRRKSESSQHGFDILILGGGAAGLAAARDLTARNLRVALLEARDRVGGRIHTLHEADWPAPIELGADFVHGLPDETWSILRNARLSTYEIPDAHLNLDPKSKKLAATDLYREIEAVLDRMSSVGSRDISFEQFAQQLRREKVDPKSIQLAMGYIEGLNAADAKKIGVQGIIASEEDEEEIEADRLFRISGGYDGLIRALHDSIDAKHLHLRLGVVAQSISWRKNSVTITTRDASGQLEAWHGPRAIITLPVGVLRANSVKFSPQLPASHRAAIQKIEMGAVMKVVLRLDETFFFDRTFETTTGKTKLPDQTFFHDLTGPLQTWWTLRPMRVPMLIGWAGGPKAAKLSRLSPAEIRTITVRALSKLLNVSESEMSRHVESFRVHNWQADPLAKGAYSYVGVGGSNAMKTLATPIKETLYFAGEHTHYEGMSGTVAGAIGSGERAAREIKVCVRSS